MRCFFGHSIQGAELLVWVTFGPLAQSKTTLEGVAIDRVVNVYAFLRLAIPTNPSRPELNSHAAAGMGTADT